MKLQNLFLVSSFLLAAVYPRAARSWNEHHILMPLVLKTEAPELKKILNLSTAAPCSIEDQKTLQILVEQLQLNPQGKFPSSASNHPMSQCGPSSSLSVYQVLAGTSVDDPDQGMDRDLPANPGNSVDPAGDRKWMGGFTGPSSQGFRHMYFGGWKISQPITSFQVPFHAIGKAPDRFETMANKAKEMVKSGNLIWGTRITAWAMHYIQDLAQPFHSAQLPSLRMVPWYELLAWPPSQGWNELQKQTTRVITNLHWAYEGYVQNLVMQKEDSVFTECLSNPEKYANLKFDSEHTPISKLPLAISKASMALAAELGSSEMRFFGPLLVQRGVDYTKNTHMIDFADFAVRPDLESARHDLHEVTCHALANASLASRILIKWTFQP